MAFITIKSHTIFLHACPTRIVSTSVTGYLGGIDCLNLDNNVAPRRLFNLHLLMSQIIGSKYA